MTNDCYMPELLGKGSLKFQAGGRRDGTPFDMLAVWIYRS
jgi:hypothetical protein